MAEHEGGVRAKIEWGMLEAFAREGAQEEVDLLEKVFAAQKKKFTDDPEGAKAFLTTGEQAVPDGVSPEEAAAWGQVGRVILNAYETTSRF